MIERCSSSFSLSTSKIRQINISQNTLFRLRKTLCAVFWHMCQNPVSFNFFPIILTLVAEAVLLHFLDFNHSSYHRLILESESECCSVMSNSLQPHGLYSPWNSPGQNTGVGEPFPSPGDLPNPGIKPCSPALQADSLPVHVTLKIWGWALSRTLTCTKRSMLYIISLVWRIEFLQIYLGSDMGCYKKHYLWNL